MPSGGVLATEDADVSSIGLQDSPPRPHHLFSLKKRSI